VSSPVEPLFAPLTLVGLLILLYIVIRLIHVLSSSALGQRHRCRWRMAAVLLLAGRGLIAAGVVVRRRGRRRSLGKVGSQFARR
jgi:hypothetical protein